MHITEYFVILYSELQEIMKKFQVAYITHQSILNLENEASKEAAKEASKEASKEAAKEAAKEASKEASKKVTKEVTKEAAKEAEEEINIKEIYRKLLFIFHPDKSISPNEEIFGEIKKAWDNKYEPTIIFYFIKNCDHPMLKIIHDRLHNTIGFLNFLKNLCNMITNEINNIRRTPIWKKYYKF
jgi:seryl-tRNA synthetase